MSTAGMDNWDDHWSVFRSVSEIGPTPKYRRRLIFRLLRNLPHNARMLEIGSGTGEFAEEFRRRFPVTPFLGVELSAVGVQAAQRRVPSARFIQRDLLHRDAAEAFGATHALCSEVLEHIDCPEVLLRNAAEYMAPDCRLIVTVPGGPMNAFYRHIGHRRHYSPSELRTFLESAGFTVERAWGAGFPFYDAFRAYMTLRGESFMQAVSGEASLAIRIGGLILNGLFRCNLPWFGWQTLALARFIEARLTA